MILPGVKIEKELALGGAQMIIGIDEAGRGPLAGPVVAAAAWVHPGALDLEFKSRQLIRDSKSLSEKQREEIYKFLIENELFMIGIGEVSHVMIDRINILNATLLAMRLAVQDLLGNTKDSEKKICLVIDGNKKIPHAKHEQHLFPKGDRNIFSIAAASICAKVHRDAIMKKYHEKFPGYGFDKHKGYGTQLHMEQLQKNGPCRIHRKSFAPVRELL